MQFLGWVLQMLVPSRSGRHRGKITSMQGTHIFWRDRTTQLIKCTLWSIRLCPHPTIIKKIPIPQPTNTQYRPPQLDTNPNVRKDNAIEKRKSAMPTKRFWPSAAPKHSGTATHPLQLFPKPQLMSNPKQMLLKIDPPLENTPVHKSTPWPGTGRMSGNLFKDRNWLLPLNYFNSDNKNATGIARSKSPIKEEPNIGEWSIVNPKAEKCGWGPNCPFCKNQDKEDWDDKHQSQLQQKASPQPKIQMPQARWPHPLNYQKPQNSQKSNQETQIDRYPRQTKIHEQSEAEMEKLNTKYNLDCFSDSKLESDEGEQYKYKHGYETLI